MFVVVRTRRPERVAWAHVATTHLEPPAIGSVASSLRLYREERLEPTPMTPVRVPLAVSQPTAEEYPTPESWRRCL